MAASDRTAAGHPLIWLRARGLMSWRRVYPGRLDQIAAARSFPAFLLADTGRAGDAELVTAELVNNALLHTRSGEPRGWFGVEVTRGNLARIAIHDLGGAQSPRILPTSPDGSSDSSGNPSDPAEHGYGLRVVAELAVQVGCAGSPREGHTVWALLALDLSPQQRAC